MIFENQAYYKKLRVSIQTSSFQLAFEKLFYTISGKKP